MVTFDIARVHALQYIADLKHNIAESICLRRIQTYIACWIIENTEESSSTKKKKYNQAQAAGARTLSFSTGHRIVHIHASCKHAWMQWSYRKGILYWMHKHGLAMALLSVAIVWRFATQIDTCDVCWCVSVYQSNVSAEQARQRRYAITIGYRCFYFQFVFSLHVFDCDWYCGRDI